MQIQLESLHPYFIVEALRADKNMILVQDINIYTDIYKMISDIKINLSVMNLCS